MKRIFGYAAAALLLATAGLSLRAARNDFGMGRNMEILVNFMRELSAWYVDETDPDELMRNAAEGMTSHLDPYTEYLPEEGMSDFEFMTTGKYGGIGSLIRLKGDRVAIAQPYRGTPADRAGLRIGDRFVSIDGKSAAGMTTADVSAALKGTPGTPVRIEIEKWPSGDTVSLRLVRERIAISGVGYAGMLNDSIGYIQHHDFTEGCYADLRAKLDTLLARGMKGLVLDYRNNGGGILQEAVKIVGLFTPRGTEVVTTRGRRENKVFRTSDDPVAPDLPLAVLVNDNTASAAEIVSGALQDLDRAVLIGRRTFGKGLVQSTRPVGYNSYLKLTTAKYYIPSGRCIQAIDYSSRDEKGAVRHVPDSLIGAFRTAGGRTVYDGGGIQPDIRTEADYISRFAMTLYAMGLIDDYADLYVRTHGWHAVDNRTFSITEADYDDFVRFMADKEVPYSSETRLVLDRLRKALENDHYDLSMKVQYEALEAALRDDKATNLETYRREIIRTINSAVVLRYSYADGVTEHSVASDKEVRRAAELLADPQEMRRILTEQDLPRDGAPAGGPEPAEE